MGAVTLFHANIRPPQLGRSRFLRQAYLPLATGAGTDSQLPVNQVDATMSQEMVSDVLENQQHTQNQHAHNDQKNRELSSIATHQKLHWNYTF
jgi:hypothetical protein